MEALVGDFDIRKVHVVSPGVVPFISVGFFDIGSLKTVKLSQFEKYHSRARLYRVLKGNRNWFDTVGIRYI